MATPTREQVVQSFELAKEDWLAYDDWQYADREAVWKYFYLHGRADLEATIAEKDVEIAQTRTTAEYWKTEHIAGNQLIAEQQAHIEVIREALEFLNARIVTMDLGGVVEKALAIQSSTDALREHDAQLVEKIADRNLTAGTRIFLAEIADKIRNG